MLLMEQSDQGPHCFHSSSNTEYLTSKYTANNYLRPPILRIRVTVTYLHITMLNRKRNVSLIQMDG